MLSASFSSPDLSVAVYRPSGKADTPSSSVSIPNVNEIHVNDVLYTIMSSWGSGFLSTSLVGQLHGWKPNSPSSFCIALRVLRAQFVQLRSRIRRLESDNENIKHSNDLMASEVKALNTELSSLRSEYYADVIIRRRDLKNDQHTIRYLEKDNKARILEASALKDENMKLKKELELHKVRIAETDKFLQALVDIRTHGSVLYNASQLISQYYTAEDALVRCIMAAGKDKDSAWSRILVEASARCPDPSKHELDLDALCSLCSGPIISPFEIPNLACVFQEHERIKNLSKDYKTLPPRPRKNPSLEGVVANIEERDHTHIPSIAIEDARGDGEMTPYCSAIVDLDSTETIKDLTQIKEPIVPFLPETRNNIIQELALPEVDKSLSASCSEEGLSVYLPNELTIIPEDEPSSKCPYSGETQGFASNSNNAVLSEASATSSSDSFPYFSLTSSPKKLLRRHPSPNMKSTKRHVKFASPVRSRLATPGSKSHRKPAPTKIAMTPRRPLTDITNFSDTEKFNDADIVNANKGERVAKKEAVVKHPGKSIEKRHGVILVDKLELPEKTAARLHGPPVLPDPSDDDVFFVENVVSNKSDFVRNSFSSMSTSESIDEDDETFKHPDDSNMRNSSNVYHSNPSIISKSLEVCDRIPALISGGSSPVVESSESPTPQTISRLAQCLSDSDLGSLEDSEDEKVDDDEDENVDKDDESDSECEHIREALGQDMEDHDPNMDKFKSIHKMLMDEVERKEFVGDDDTGPARYDNGGGVEPLPGSFSELSSNERKNVNHASRDSNLVSGSSKMESSPFTIVPNRMFRLSAAAANSSIPARLFSKSGSSGAKKPVSTTSASDVWNPIDESCDDNNNTLTDSSSGSSYSTSSSTSSTGAGTPSSQPAQTTISEYGTSVVAEVGVSEKVCTSATTASSAKSKLFGLGRRFARGTSLSTSPIPSTGGKKSSSSGLGLPLPSGIKGKIMSSSESSTLSSSPDSSYKKSLSSTSPPHSPPTSKLAKPINKLQISGPKPFLHQSGLPSLKSMSHSPEEKKLAPVTSSNTFGLPKPSVGMPMTISNPMPLTLKKNTLLLVQSSKSNASSNAKATSPLHSLSPPMEVKSSMGKNIIRRLSSAPSSKAKEANSPIQSLKNKSTLLSPTQIPSTPQTAPTKPRSHTINTVSPLPPSLSTPSPQSLMAGVAMKPRSHTFNTYTPTTRSPLSQLVSDMSTECEALPPTLKSSTAQKYLKHKRGSKRSTGGPSSLSSSQQPLPNSVVPPRINKNSMKSSSKMPSTTNGGHSRHVRTNSSKSPEPPIAAFMRPATQRSWSSAPSGNRRTTTSVAPLIPNWTPSPGNEAMTPTQCRSVFRNSLSMVVR